MHPLVGDISEMKDADIEAKIYDLTNKYFNTRNPDIKAEEKVCWERYCVRNCLIMR